MEMLSIEMNPHDGYETVQAAVEAVEGFMMPGQEAYLFNKVRSLPEDGVIVEIGSFKGRSTVAMGYACVGTQRRIYCIDTWDGNEFDFDERNFFETWQDNIQRNGLRDYVVPLRGYSHPVLRDWQALTNGVAIDFIFVDGSHQYLDVLLDFQLAFPLVKDGGWMAFHDVIYTWRGCEQTWLNVASQCLINHEYASSLACGQKTAALPLVIPRELPIHFFTIVLNGEPFIRYHLNVLKYLPFQWHWHIVEGLAALKHDTAWSVSRGGRVTDELHDKGRSNDGTSAYLDELVAMYPDRVTLYRKPENEFWDGKLEMVNAPLVNIQEDCLLWQIDADELWTAEQIEQARSLFLANPDRTAACFRCWYFVGENLVISNRGEFTQHPNEWLRLWRFQPGAIWSAHEPPTLVEPVQTDSEMQWREVARVNPILEAETEPLGLVFQHFSYVTPAQLQFKEIYYGYANTTAGWESLQTQTRFPVLLRQFFPWIDDAATVDTAEACGVAPLAQRDPATDRWQFVQPGTVLDRTQIPKPRILVDGVSFQFQNAGMARVWRSLLQTWAQQDFSQHLMILDRGNTAPAIPGLVYRSIPAYTNDLEYEQNLLQQICDEEAAALFISTFHTAPINTPVVALAYDLIPEIGGWRIDLNPLWQAKQHILTNAAAVLALSESVARDLPQVFPTIAPDAITTTPLAASPDFSPATAAEIQAFKTQYGIRQPYFLLDAPDLGYQSHDRLFFEAFSGLCSRQGFDLVIANGALHLDSELRAFAAGSTIHLLPLEDAELRAAYSGAIAYVHPAQHDALGLSLLEAMACDCPVIAVKTPTIAELVGNAALFVSLDDRAGMTAALAEIQKPSVRQALITAGRARSSQVSFTALAERLQATLLATTLLSLNLQAINLIAFPDWQQPEESLLADLLNAVKTVFGRRDRAQVTLLIVAVDVDGETANLALSEVTMHLLMEAGVETVDPPELSLITELSPLQWRALLPRIQAKISLNQENQALLTQLENFADVTLVKLEATS